MARPRQHASAAAKQAAYRARLAEATSLVDRVALSRLQDQLETLQQVIAEATRQGDPFARQCRAGSVETMLDKLIVAFQNQSSPRTSCKG